jgi:hypothetical protein
MARSRNPLSNRNRNEQFSGEEVASFVQRLAASKRAKVVRERGDFDVRDLQSIVKAPFIPPATYSWSIENIVLARDQQMAGRFRLPARLSESFGTDDAIFTARGVRLAPVQSLGVVLSAGGGGKGDKIADEATALFGEKGIAISSATITSIRKDIADHGVGFGAVGWTARADGSRIDPIVTPWPIEFVWWDPVRNCYMTQVRRLECDSEPTGSGIYMPASAIGVGSPFEAIVHGNGRWVVFSKSELLPHRLDAAVLPASLVWARHAFANRDWTKGSASHGNPKVIGELPADTALTAPDKSLTAEATAFLALLSAVASQDAPVGIRPAGSKIDYLTNQSRAWEVWKELVANAEKAAARIYLGTDGILGSVGGAPGVDISALFGVATSKIQSDLTCIEAAIQSGVIAPWTALNFGDDKSAPTRKYVFPDPDEAQVREGFAKRNAAFNADVKSYRDNGFVVDQALIGKIAAAHGVPAPLLPPVAATKAPSIALAPTDLAKAVQANEARASGGLGPLLDAEGKPDPRGTMLLSELDAPVPEPLAPGQSGGG